MGLYRLKDLTNWERWQIRKHTRTPMEETAKKFNTSVSVVFRVLGCRKPNLDRVKQIFADGSYKIWDRIEHIPYNKAKVRECLKGEREVFKNSIWRWKDKPNPKKIKVKPVKMKAKNKGKPVLQLDMDGNFIKEFRTILEASKALGIPQGNISNISNGIYGYKSAKGFKFEFKYKSHKIPFKQERASNLW